MNSSSKEIICKYLFENNYSPVYINGAHGGVNSRGEIVVHFYLERQALPYSLTLKVDEDGYVKNDEILKTEPEELENSFVRHVSNGVVMNLQTAKLIKDWLSGHIERLESIVESNNESKNENS